MGRRSRKRGVSTTVQERPAPEATKPPSAETSRSRKSFVDRTLEKAEQRPKAPWDPFPLVELSVLAGIVLIILGIINNETRNGKLLLAFGLTLASLAGLDTAAREHFGGFRSHSTLLAGVPAVIAAALLFFLRAPVITIPVIAVLVGTAAFFLFRAEFRKRSGGLSFKV